MMQPTPNPKISVAVNYLAIAPLEVCVAYRLIVALLAVAEDHLSYNSVAKHDENEDALFDESTLAF